MMLTWGFSFGLMRPKGISQTGPGGSGTGLIAADPHETGLVSRVNHGSDWCIEKVKSHLL